jgi:arginine deiminase
MSTQPLLHSSADPSGAPAPRLFVGSEVAPLQRVIVHRPGTELSRLTRENTTEMLFDDVIWTEGATEEHDALTGALRRRGVEVLYLEELLAEALAIPEARRSALIETVSPQPGGARAGIRHPRLAGHTDRCLTCPIERADPVRLSAV